MALDLAKKGRLAALKIIVWQLSIITLASLMGLYWGIQEALSLLTGGGISVVSTLSFIYFAFQFSGAQMARKMVRGFYLGEASKFLLAIVLMVIVFKWTSVLASTCLIGFVLATIVQMIAAPIVVKTT